MPRVILSEEDKRILQELHDDYISKYGTLSLHRAAEVASLLITERFLDEGMEATALDEEGHDPLFVAVRFMIFEGLTFTDEYKEIFAMLAKRGADVQALRALEDEDLDDYEGAVLANVIVILNEAAQAESTDDSDDTTLTAEDAEEPADTSSNRKSSGDSKETNETVATLNNHDEHQNSNSTLQDTFNYNASQEFSFVLVNTTNNPIMLENSPEMQAYKEAIETIAQEDADKNAKVRTFIEEDGRILSIPEFPPLEDYDDITPPSSIISDPLIHTQFSILAGASLGLLFALSSHDLPD